MLDIKDIKNLDSESVAFFRFKKFENWDYLLTNDAGKFIFLNASEFTLFVTGNHQNLSKYEELLEKGFIKDKDYEKKMTGSFALRNSYVWVWPTLHMIIVTLRCNHKCKYCHAAVAPMTATQFDMDEQTAKKTVDAIFYTNSPFLTIEFQWGEALVNYEIVQFIVDYARKKADILNKKLTFSLVSNLTLMTEEKLTRLLDNGVDICSSLDGDELTHNFNRAWYDGNSYETVTYWLKRLNEEKIKRKVGFASALLTVTSETMWKYEKIIDTYVELGMKGIFLRWLNPYWFAAADLKKLSYSKDDWIDFYKSSLDYIIELNKKGVEFTEYITSVFLRKIFEANDPNFMDIRSPSWIAVWWVAYNYDGKVYASDESRMLGRMWDDNFFMTPLMDTGEATYTAMIQSDITKIAVQSSCLDGLPGYNEHPYQPYIWVDIIHNYKTQWSIFGAFKKDEKIQMQIAIIDYIFTKLQNPEDKKILLSWIGK